MISIKHIPLQTSQYLIPLLVILIASIAFIFDDALSPMFVYHRADISDGDIWQLFTAHFFHTNLNHFLLNIGALGLLWLLHGHYYSVKNYLCVFTFSALFTGICIYLFSPSISQYVGLSGVLHGIFIWGAIVDIKEKENTGYLLLIGAVLKLGHEQLYGASDDVVAMINATVAVDAHLYGAVSGALIALVLLPFNKQKT